MKKLILTVGIPQSGKSTWALQQDCPVVNPDSVRYALYGQPFIRSAEPFIWAIVKCMVHALFIAGHTKVILDATNITILAREKWFSSSWELFYHEFQLDPENSKQRAKINTKSKNHFDNLCATIDRMTKAYEPVTTKEGIILYQ